MQNQYSNTESAKKFEYFKQLFEDKQYKRIDTPSIMSELGDDLTNKTIIDFGCGTGYYTRQIARKALRIVGVDASFHMIEVAKQLSEKDGLQNVEYYVKDCSKQLDLGEFDLVFSTHFLLFAKNIDTFKQFVRSMYASLKANGRCLGAIMNINVKPDEFHYLWKYGYEFIRDKNAQCGHVHTSRFYEGMVGTSSCLYEIRCLYLTPEMFEEAFIEAGFVNFKFINFTLDSSYYTEQFEYFEDYLKYPAGIMYSAEKVSINA